MRYDFLNMLFILMFASTHKQIKNHISESRQDPKMKLIYVRVLSHSNIW